NKTVKDRDGSVSWTIIGDGLCDTTIVPFRGHQNSSTRPHLVRVMEAKQRDELGDTELGFPELSVIPVSFRDNSISWSNFSAMSSCHGDSLSLCNFSP
ncbi:hypothetical protein HAX54_022773, partial [Datura stramonium]|nr:hypothetical protein [Datura stramonium]